MQTHVWSIPVVPPLLPHLVMLTLLIGTAEKSAAFGEDGRRSRLQALGGAARPAASPQRAMCQRTHLGELAADGEMLLG